MCKKGLNVMQSITQFKFALIGTKYFDPKEVTLSQNLDFQLKYPNLLSSLCILTNYFVKNKFANLIAPI